MSGLVERLRACPFCGDSAVLNYWSSTVHALCTNCNACSCDYAAVNGDAKAIAAWNTRASDPLIEQLVEALEEAVCFVPTCQKTALAKFTATLSAARGEAGKDDPAPTPNPVVHHGALRLGDRS